jgi:hypothetical protein
MALRRAETTSVLVRGALGTGKSSLANLIAVQAAEAGLTCLLVGSSSELERPLAFQVASSCHPILIRRARLPSRQITTARKADLLAARGRLDPTAMQVALRAQRRARALMEMTRP